MPAAQAVAPAPDPPTRQHPTRWLATRPTRRRGCPGHSTTGSGSDDVPPDLVGTSRQVAERLHAHAAFRAVDEVPFALPFTFDHDDYVQILTDMAGVLGPLLGRHPWPEACE